MVQTRSNNEYTTPPDEISIKLFLQIVISYCKLLLKLWYLIALTAILFGAYKYHTISKIKETYPAKVKIFLRPQDIAKENQLSVKIFAQLINSRSLLEKLFISKTEMNGEQRLLINHYLKTYYKLKPNELSEDIPFGFRIKNNTLDNLETTERKVFNLVIDKVMKPLSDFSDGFVSVSADFELGFVTINVSTPSEALSLGILDLVCDKGIKLFRESAVFAENKAFNNMNSQTDSLSDEYKKGYYKLNNYRDRRTREMNKEKPDSKNVKYLEKRINKLEVQTEIYKTQYLASLEQEKVAKINLDQNALLVHLLEKTMAPINPYSPNSKVSAIKSGIVGIILAMFLIVLVRIALNIAKELA